MAFLDDADADIDPPLVTAPFTADQVEALNRWQQAGRVHPFTCGNQRHTRHVNLVATEAGWVCPASDCRYTQDWAYQSMTEPLPPDPFAHLLDGGNDI